MNAYGTAAGQQTGTGTLISLTDVRLSLQGNPVLRGVSLEMEKGEICGMLGPNGAGKSTTISVIAALRMSASGSVRVLGMDPRKRPEDVRRRIGVLAENAGFYDWMTGREYLSWFAGLYSRQLGARECDELLSSVGLARWGRHPIGRYSRGMRQRLGLARAMVNTPELLILDEPTSGLDPEGRRHIHDLLQELNYSRGIGILLSTHLLDDVERLCSRVAIIHGGRTILEGETRSLVERRMMLRRYLIRLREPFPAEHEALPNGVSVLRRRGDQFEVEIAGDAPVDFVWRMLMASGWSIVEIALVHHSLEEVYLAAVRKGEQDERHCVNSH